jgi:hypothetical protein
LTLCFQSGPRYTDPMGKDVRTVITLDEFERIEPRMAEVRAAEPVPAKIGCWGFRSISEKGGGL